MCHLFLIHAPATVLAYLQQLVRSLPAALDSSRWCVILCCVQALDAALRIGIPPAAITELVGPAGVGKSQFCYTLALQVSEPPPTWPSHHHHRQREIAGPVQGGLKPETQALKP